MNASTPPGEQSFFDKERERLTADIASSFEELLLSSNVLNRKLEELIGMRKEFATIADLWQSFHEVMREQKPEIDLDGIPGTGGHVVAAAGASTHSTYS